MPRTPAKGAPVKLTIELSLDVFRTLARAAAVIGDGCTAPSLAAEIVTQRVNAAQPICIRRTSPSTK